MIKLRVADTEKDMPSKIELIPETFDELSCRAYEIYAEEQPIKIGSYVLIINDDRFVIISKNSLGNIVAVFYFERAFQEKDLGWFHVDDCRIRKKMSIKRLYFIVKGLLEGERL